MIFEMCLKNKEEPLWKAINSAFKAEGAGSTVRMQKAAILPVV